MFVVEFGIPVASLVVKLSFEYAKVIWEYVGVDTAIVGVVTPSAAIFSLYSYIANLKT